MHGDVDIDAYSAAGRTSCTGRFDGPLSSSPRRCSRPVGGHACSGCGTAWWGAFLDPSSPCLADCLPTFLAIDVPGSRTPGCRMSDRREVRRGRVRDGAGSCTGVRESCAQGREPRIGRAPCSWCRATPSNHQARDGRPSPRIARRSSGDPLCRSCANGCSRSRTCPSSLPFGSIPHVRIPPGFCPRGVRRVRGRRSSSIARDASSTYLASAPSSRNLERSMALMTYQKTTTNLAAP